MVRGLYTAAAGMLTIEERTAVAANNLANIDTAGFKRDMLEYISAPTLKTWRVNDPGTRDEQGHTHPQYVGLTPAGVADTRVWHDFSMGAAIDSGNPLDIYITDKQPGSEVSFLRLRDPQSGTEYYSRAGQLKLDGQGYLVDPQGRRLQGEDGDIVVSDSVGAYINASGEVISGGSVAGRIKLARFTDPQAALDKRGDNLWELKGDASAPAKNGLDEGASLLPGVYEGSNSDAITSIVELISAMRHYEAAQKVIQSEDAELNIAANQLGRMPQQ